MARAKGSAHNLIDAALKKQFLEMRDHWKGLDDQAKKFAKKRATYQKEIKAAGFQMSQVKTSVLLSTPEGEARFQSDMANLMLAAAYSDAAIGEQLSLFLEPGRTPAVDIAAREGQTDAMQNKAARPKYDPSTDQHQSYMEAYHAEQERQVKAGIGKLDAKAGNGKAEKPAKGPKAGKGAKAAAKADKPAGKRGRPPGTGSKAKDAAPPRKPAATPVTRASLAAAKADAPADSYFSKSAETKGNA